MSGKRNNYLRWDEYFMSITSLAELKGLKDYSGACLIDKNKRILSIGFNHIPSHIRTGIENDHSFLVDALSNTLYSFKGRRQEFEDGTLYLTYFPNYEESKQIVQARIKNIFYLVKDVDEETEQISRYILDCGKVNVEPYYDDYYSKKEYRNFLEELRNVIKENIGKTDSPVLIDDEYFMSVCSLAALRSKDPSTQVGACLVGKNNQILSIGYNGAPFQMDDDFLPWDSIGEKTGDLLRTKNPYVVHAEMNTFDNYRGNQSDLEQTSLYLTYSPCENCSKRISLAHLERIVYLREFKNSRESTLWLNRANIIREPYYQDRDISKKDCLRLFEETTKVIKKNLGR